MTKSSYSTNQSKDPRKILNIHKQIVKDKNDRLPQIGHSEGFKSLIEKRVNDQNLDSDKKIKLKLGDLQNKKLIDLRKTFSFELINSRNDKTPKAKSNKRVKNVSVGSGFSNNLRQKAEKRMAGHIYN